MLQSAQAYTTLKGSGGGIEPPFRRGSLSGACAVSSHSYNNVQSTIAVVSWVDVGRMRCAKVSTQAHTLSTYS